jgi:hypothetical protein
MTKDKTVKKFLKYLKRWHDIKSRFDFKNPTLSTKEIWQFKYELKKELSDPRFLKIADSWYEQNPVDYIEHWIVTYDPKRGLGITPFVLFPKQEDFIEWVTALLDKKESGLVEKTREVGMSWMAIAWSTWTWKYKKNAKIGFGSRKASLVDTQGDLDSIFEKFRLVLRNIPAELLPFNFSVKKHTPEMRIINPENQNSITGEGGDNIGRGGRNTIYFKDESAFYERAEKIEAALSENTDVQVDISTPNGVGNPFHRKRFGGQVKVFTFRWTDDPRKDQDWYDERVRKLGSTIVAQEIDINYEASLSNVVIPNKWVMCTVELELKIRTEEPLVAGFDVAGGGVDKNAYPLRHDSTIKRVMQWNDADSVSATHECVRLGAEDGIETLYLDPIGVGDGAVGTLRQNPPPFEWFGVDSRHRPSDDFFEEEEKLCSEKFINKRAELWWKMRRRFERTYEYVKKGVQHKHEEMISIPNDPQLITELSSPLFFHRDSGKLKIESKEDMRRRGVASPNMADAVVMCFADEYSDFLGYL